MNLFNQIKNNLKPKNKNPRYNPKSLLADNSQTIKNLSIDDDFSIFDINNFSFNDTYLIFAWVNIAVNILTRNIARADFTIKKEGDDVKSGAVYDLFRKPNASLSRFDLWKETAAWWFIEGEAFW